MIAGLTRSRPLDDFADLAPGRDNFLSAVLAGLSQPQKTLPCKYFYDERGSALFEQICALPEYYPTRTESAILARFAADMASHVPPGSVVVEFGSGASTKSRLLLDALPIPAAYLPVDISREHLLETAAALAVDYPSLSVIPVCADFTRPFALPASTPRGPRLCFFPGSTIGNFTHQEAVTLLAQIRGLIGTGGMLLIGVDLEKDVRILEAAYNDAAGVTAAFNLNLLHRMNRELQATFEIDRFSHRAIFNPAKARMEMYLVSDVLQTVHLAGRRFTFRPGETIHTENSHKYSIDRFAALADGAGLACRRTWLDADRLFSVHLLASGGA